MQPTSPTSPRTALLARVLQRFASVEPHETGPVITAFLLFFFMWGGYFAVRPVRETIGTILGRDETADVWVYTSVFAVLSIPLYGALVARVRRSVFLPCIYGAVAIVLVVTGIAMRGTAINLLVGKFFYVFISVVNLLLISVFWSFLLELFTTPQTKRLFGVIAAGGSAGALLGPLVVSEVLLSRIGNGGVLYFGAGLFLVAIFCQRALLAYWSTNIDISDNTSTNTSAAATQGDRPLGGNIFAGVPLLLRSPYLLGIALFVIGVSTVNTLLYFEQLRFVELYFPDVTDRTRVFARFDWIVQALTVLSQLLITGQLAQRFGVTTLLISVPLGMVLGFLTLAIGFSFYPLPATGGAANLLPGSFIFFWILAAVVILRRAGEYALARPAREMLWSKLDKETKYKAKNTVDVPVYRATDVIVAQVDKGLNTAGFGPVVVAVLGVVVTTLWAALAWWLGRRYENLQSEAVTAPEGTRPMTYTTKS